MTQARELLDRQGVRERAWSGLLSSAPMGGQGQPVFSNAVGLYETPKSAAALLRVIKRLERAAGRAQGRRWGPRPLDIDIVDYKGLVIASRGAQAVGRPMPGLRIPHVGLEERAFVLDPMAAILDRWNHPVSGTALPVLRRRARRAQPSLPRNRRKQGTVKSKRR